MERNTYFGYKFFVFPFKDIERDEEIILYGFGEAGKQYYWLINSNNYCKIKYIVDKDYTRFQQTSFDVRSPQDLKNDQDTKIVVSVQNGRNTIINDLIRLGVNEKNIVFSDAYVVLPLASERAFTISSSVTNTREGYISEKGADAYLRLKMMNQYLRIYSVKKYKYSDCNVGYIRVGRDYDGGYIMLNSLEDNNEKKAYSFGIADDVSWDSDMVEMGYDVYMYDHTISELPYEKEGFHFFKKGISNTQESCDDLETLEKILRCNGHQDCSSMVLKMDVEGAEYGFINSTDSQTLEKFDQIVIEYHDLLKDDRRDERIRALEKMLISHVPVHIHVNNLGDTLFLEDIIFADCMEVTYVSRHLYSGFQIVSDDEIYLNDVDKPCWPEKDEVYLKNWNSAFE